MNARKITKISELAAIVAPGPDDDDLNVLRDVEPRVAGFLRAHGVFMLPSDEQELIAIVEDLSRRQLRRVNDVDMGKGQVDKFNASAAAVHGDEELFSYALSLVQVSEVIGVAIGFELARRLQAGWR